jgi:hypothetical protein
MLYCRCLRPNKTVPHGRTTSGDSRCCSGNAAAYAPQSDAFTKLFFSATLNVFGRSAAENARSYASCVAATPRILVFKHCTQETASVISTTTSSLCVSLCFGLFCQPRGKSLSGRRNQGLSITAVVLRITEVLGASLLHLLGTLFVRWWPCIALLHALSTLCNNLPFCSSAARHLSITAHRPFVTPSTCFCASCGCKHRTLARAPTWQLASISTHLQGTPSVAAAHQT